MSYSEPLINQIRVLLLSVGMGVPLCLLYILVHSFFRIIGKGNKFIFAADIIFSVFGALISFFFMVFYNNGRVRLHCIMGEALGFFLFYRAAGKHLLCFSLKAADMLCRLKEMLLYPFVRVGRAFVGIFLSAAAFIKKKEKSIKEKRDKKRQKSAEEAKKVDTE